MKQVIFLVSLLMFSVSSYASNWKVSDYADIAFVRTDANGNTLVQLNTTNAGTCYAVQFTGDAWAVKGDGQTHGYLTVYAIPEQHQHMVSQVLMAYSMGRKVRLVVNDNPVDYPRIGDPQTGMCQVQRVIMNRHNS